MKALVKPAIYGGLVCGVIGAIARIFCGGVLLRIKGINWLEVAGICFLFAIAVATADGAK